MVAFWESPLHGLDESSQQSTQLNVGELFTDTSVSTTTEWQVWRGDTLRDRTETVIDSVSASVTVVIVVLEVVVPSVWVECFGLWEVGFVGVGEAWRD
ncbi:hypothetical protein WICPIJ_001505 [Wickerhamomyces pijperi]|uniref:Uncharacterized protein n=1 Tax=Wickerhamomyces pijperi TaxID=599730 RepID=A0A9P8TQJ1_WICPI|nr:hypothetical protein WICPIJ_001505 [Wickerhamomyces pijperi]